MRQAIFFAVFGQAARAAAQRLEVNIVIAFAAIAHERQTFAVRRPSHPAIKAGIFGQFRQHEKGIFLARFCIHYRQLKIDFFHFRTIAADDHNLAFISLAAFDGYQVIGQRPHRIGIVAPRFQRRQFAHIFRLKHLTRRNFSMRCRQRWNRVQVVCPHRIGSEQRPCGKAIETITFGHGKKFHHYLFLI